MVFIRAPHGNHLEPISMMGSDRDVVRSLIGIWIVLKLPDQSDLSGCCWVLWFKEASSAFKVTSIRLLFLVRRKDAGCKRLGVLHYCWSFEKVYMKHS